MIRKIRTRFSEIKNGLEKGQIKSLPTKLSISHVDVRKEKAVDNDYVGVRFNRQHPSSDNTNEDKRKFSRSASTISTVITGSTNDVTAEVHELDTND